MIRTKLDLFEIEVHSDVLFGKDQTNQRSVELVRWGRKQVREMLNVQVGSCVN